MGKSSLRIAELLSSRLCHDLVTPMGAIHTGLELFQETPSGHNTDSEEILNLILQSAQTATARLSFFRVAFGSSGGDTSFGEAKQLIENFYKRSKIEFQWDENFESNLVLEGWGRLLLNLVLWMSECAPRGGLIQINVPKKECACLSLVLKAESIILHQGTIEALEGKVSLDDLSPRTIPCYLIHCLVAEKGRTLSHHKTTTPSALSLEVKTDASLKKCLQSSL